MWKMQFDIYRINIWMKVQIITDHTEAGTSISKSSLEGRTFLRWRNARNVSDIKLKFCSINNTFLNNKKDN